jgi:transcriptional regulator with XRE-family HTH domain
MDEQAKAIGERIKKVRESTGKSQKEFATQLDASYRTVQDYEAGNSVPGGKVLERFLCLGFNVNWILAGEGEMRLRDAGQRLPLLPNNDYLEAAMDAVDEYLVEIGDSLPNTKKSKLVRILYRMAETRKMNPERDMVIDLVGLARS